MLATIVSVSSFGAVKTYQVTGPVLEIRSDAIVVQKGKDRWEIARDGATRVVGNLRVGSKVTIEYRRPDPASTSSSWLIWLIEPSPVVLTGGDARPRIRSG